MSWSSHPFHILRELQTFAAALVAFAAAALTFYSQKRVSERQAESALVTTNMQIEERREKYIEEIVRTQYAFMIEASLSSRSIAMEIGMRSSQASFFLKNADLRDGLVYLSEEDNGIGALIGNPLFRNKFTILNTNFDIIKMLAPEVQLHYFSIRHIAFEIDFLIESIADQAASHKRILPYLAHKIVEMEKITVPDLERIADELDVIRKFSANPITASSGSSDQIKTHSGAVMA